ncbi:MAG: 2-oxoacid:ferredoxin oxidoreductase subunit gamma [Desulfuromonas sp.]|nr:MAG: 2-oxoacid:ferredoxin oxidoreductase subunit gamma [Desulfuromonas sp.]
MDYNVYMTGFGGQGIMLIGNLLAYAGIREGKNVSYYPSYGVEKRGGAANCTINVSDQPVGSPVVGHPAAALILNQGSYDLYLDRVQSGGFCLLNSSLIEEKADARSDLNYLRLPLNEMALKLGDARLVNMISIGAYAQQSGAVGLQTLKDALKDVLPERNHRFIPLNEQALDLGAASLNA